MHRSALRLVRGVYRLLLICSRREQGKEELSELLGDIGAAVVAHHLQAINSLIAEPGNGPGKKANQR